MLLKTLLGLFIFDCILSQLNRNTCLINQRMLANHSGLCGPELDNFTKKRFWCLISTLGQIHHRLVRPYQRFPFSLAQLIDLSNSPETRIALAQKALDTSDCCRDKFFSTPLLTELESCGGSRAVLPGVGTLFDDIKTAFTGKTTNIACELSFARASSMRQCMRGRKHSISSMASKHIVAECKLYQLRGQTPSSSDAAQLVKSDPARGKGFDKYCIHCLVWCFW